MQSAPDPEKVAAIREGRLKLVTAALGLLTAILTAAVALLGFVTKKATDRVDDSEQRVEALQSSNVVLATQSVEAQKTIAALRTQLSAAPTAGPPSAPPSPSAQGSVKVKLDDLCRRPDAHSYICGVDNGTIEVGDQVFPYVAEGNGNANNKPPAWHQLLSLDNPNNCTGLTVRFASDRGGTANIRLTQVDTAAQEGHADAHKIGTFTAKLNGTAFKLAFNTSDGRPIFADGTATCLTGSGD
jgi:hypothetical protein